MSGAVKIRPADPADRAIMLDLWERSVRATHDFLTEADIQALRPLVAEELASDSTQWWVAALGAGELAGFLACMPGVIDGLFVDPTYRGHGVGTSLIAHAQRRASGSLRVDVNEQNTAARGFYESLGFTVVGRSPVDGAGRPFPLLHMERRSPRSSATGFT
jgi:putative acetyltransferase